MLLCGSFKKNLQFSIFVCDVIQYLFEYYFALTLQPDSFSSVSSVLTFESVKLSGI